jgi:hypothetical protein
MLLFQYTITMIINYYWLFIQYIYSVLLLLLFITIITTDDYLLLLLLCFKFYVYFFYFFAVFHLQLICLCIYFISVPSGFGLKLNQIWITSPTLGPYFGSWELLHQLKSHVFIKHHLHLLNYHHNQHQCWLHHKHLHQLLSFLALCCLLKYHQSRLYHLFHHHHHRHLHLLNY